MKKNNNENFFGDYIDIDIITPEKNTIKAKKQVISLIEYLKL